MPDLKNVFKLGYNYYQSLKFLVTFCFSSEKMKLIVNISCFLSGEIKCLQNKTQYFEVPPKHLPTNIKEFPNKLIKLSYDK